LGLTNLIFFSHIKMGYWWYSNSTGDRAYEEGYDALRTGLNKYFKMKLKPIQKCLDRIEQGKEITSQERGDLSGFLGVVLRLLEKCIHIEETSLRLCLGICDYMVANPNCRTMEGYSIDIRKQRIVYQAERMIIEDALSDDFKHLCLSQREEFEKPEDVLSTIQSPRSL